MPSIKNKVLRESFIGLSGISKVSMTATTGLKIARLLAKLRPEVELLEKAEFTLFEQAGAILHDGVLSLPPVIKAPDESEPEFKSRLAESEKKNKELADQKGSLYEAELPLDFTPIPVAELITPDGKPANLVPADILLAGPFIKD